MLVRKISGLFVWLTEVRRQVSLKSNGRNRNLINMLLGCGSPSEINTNSDWYFHRLWDIPRNPGQCHACWCPGSFHRQVISRNAINDAHITHLGSTLWAEFELYTSLYNTSTYILICQTIHHIKFESYSYMSMTNRVNKQSLVTTSFVLVKLTHKSDKCSWPPHLA